MAEFPALPFFTDAYLADTRHLTTEEHGAYLLLLMSAWRTRGCALKDDDTFLARTVGVSLRRWRRLRPVLAEFFTVEGGVWRQKKLDDVYRNVEIRVAKNRANGAKGGRAKAARAAASAEATVKRTPAVRNAEGAGAGVPTKTRIQNPEPKAQAPDDAALERVAAAAGLDRVGLDGASLEEWLAAGATLDGDILPTIGRLRAREVGRRGKPPGILAYYGAAVLEARDERLGARARGLAHAENHPAPPPRRAFNPASEDDWRTFLGDAESRFRGDYLSRNWRIGPDHPVFAPMALGPDPRHSLNALIPEAVMRRYGPRWHWCLPPGLMDGSPQTNQYRPNCLEKKKDR